ncbi:MAG: hypothetical protein DHS20C15_27160 [Planctomycetota bacterium]|nr:MAG: hypothetical protein DHS20C15_27160 [Planctomycetota bacterium]
MTPPSPTSADSAAHTDPLLARHWEHALPWSDYLETVVEKRDLWLANARRSTLRDEERARLHALPGARRVLVLSEDWCGDALRSLPSLAQALDAAPGVEARYLPLDAHPDAIEGLRTHGGAAIPMLVVADEHGERLGSWGPRPAPLQALLRARRSSFGAPTAETMAEFYAPIMAWYAKDKGVTTLQEVLMLLERGGSAR